MPAACWCCGLQEGTDAFGHFFRVHIPWAILSRQAEMLVCTDCGADLVLWMTKRRGELARRGLHRGPGTPATSPAVGRDIKRDQYDALADELQTDEELPF